MTKTCESLYMYILKASFKALYIQQKQHKETKLGMNNVKTMAKTLDLLANAEMQDRGCFRCTQNLALCRFI